MDFGFGHHEYGSSGLKFIGQISLIKGALKYSTSKFPKNCNLEPWPGALIWKYNAFIRTAENCNFIQKFQEHNFSSQEIYFW